MKINIFRSIIILGISILTGWGFFACSSNDSLQLPVAIIICLYVLLAGEITFGIDFKQKREGIMLKIIAGIWGFCMLVINMMFLGFIANITTIFITNGILLLLFLLLANSIYKA